MRFIDARCQLGRRCVIRENEPVTKAEILELMDRCRIERAVAYHAIAKEGDVKAGNMELLKDTEGDSRFLRQWVALPHTFGEFMSVEELLKGMKENSVSSIRMFPKTHGYSLKPYALGKFMDAMAEHKIPVFMTYNELASEDALYAMLTDYPKVNFIISDVSYREERKLFPILEHCPNFHIGTGNYVVHGGVKTMCEYFGAERMIFDTGLPTGSAAAAVSLICFAEISEEEKTLIASGNLERMLSEVEL
ncbi:MAG: amidohydrolase family protein [Oscillospiraceae bacterium]|nr:amidohydrolase family protein [Oscillospiraceae bacterium]